MILNKRGFTLIELLVVIAMIAILIASTASAVGKTRERAMTERARNDVKTIAQAILAWENFATSGDRHELKEMNDEEANASSLGFLLGDGEDAKSGEIPILVMLQMSGGGVLRDPWGHPYRIRIRQGAIPPPSNLDVSTGYYLPNFYRLSAEERR